MTCTPRSQRWLVLSALVVVLLVGCGRPGDLAVKNTSEVSAGGNTTTTVVASTTTSPVATTTSSIHSTDASTTAEPTDGKADRMSLEDLGVEPGVPIDPPDDLVPTPEPGAWLQEEPIEIPYASGRFASRIEVDEKAFDEPMGDDRGSVITYIPGYVIYDSPGSGWRTVIVDGGETYWLEQDGSWTALDQAEGEHGPLFSSFTDWGQVQQTYERLFEDGMEVVGHELVAGVETVRVRYEDAPGETWADLWVDAHGIAIRVVVDVAADDESGWNRSWLIWDPLTFDPQDVGPLPPSS